MSKPVRKKIAGRLGARRRRLIYLIGLTTWTTGVVWLIFYYFIREVDRFGFPNPHPHQNMWLIAHATAALIAVWQFGVLWPQHIKNSWRQEAGRRTGGLLFSIIFTLAFTGLALYYIGNEQLRLITSLSHWILGLVALPAFFLHLLKKFF